MNLNAGYEAPQTIQATISDNTISSYQTGVVCTRLASLSGNDITDNGQAAILSGSALGGFATANTVSANGSGNAVWLTPEEGQVVADATLTPNIIWVLEPGTEGQPAGSGNLLSVAAGVTLTIEPGTVVKGEPVTTQGAYAAPGGLEIAGTLTAQGTAAAPITFTSANDDSVGGALPGSTGAPAPGDWSGLVFESGASGTLDHVRVSYAGGGYTSDAGIIVALGGVVSVDSSSIDDNAGLGIYTPPTDHGTVWAQNDWWGSDSGPDPFGTGNGVSWHWETDADGNRHRVLDVLGVWPWAEYEEIASHGYGTNTPWSGYAAEPVNVILGNYTYSHTDLGFGTRGIPIQLARTYNSMDPADGLFGVGWTSTYDVSLSADSSTGDVTVRNQDGRRDLYTLNGDGSYTPPSGVMQRSTRTPTAATRW